MRKMRTVAAGAATLTLALAIAAPTIAQEATSIEGTLVGEHWIDPEAPGCAEGSSWRFESAGVGELAGVGEVEYALSWCSVSDPETGITAYGDGGVTFTTASGDSIETAQIGYGLVIPGADPAAEPSGFTMGGSWEVVGGTGPYEDATGYGWLGGIGAIPGDATIDLHGSLVLATE